MRSRERHDRALDRAARGHTVTLTALDLFAGTGWGVACKSLGIEEHGVDNMPEVIATREANGMSTIFHDVWEGLDGRAEVPPSDLHIASPPCQSFSMAGRGAGRQALVDVLRLIQEKVYLRPLEMEALTQQEGFDDRTALVLTPLAYAVRDLPFFIAWEQVPPVLPVWEACAEVLRELGYSVWTGYLHSEQYGVPQTRKRAILMASLLGEAKPPAPTHSRYYSRSPERMDAGVLPWVSMAEALGWGMTGRPSMTVTGGGTDTGGAEPFGTEARKRMLSELEQERFIMRSNYGTSGDPANRGERGIDQPAPTVTSKVGRNKWVGGERPTNVSPEEAAVLQSFPTWPFERPAPTVVGTRRSEGGMLIGRQLDDDSRRDVGGHQTSKGLRPGMLAGVRVSGEQAAALQSFPVDRELLAEQVRSRVNDQTGTAYDPTWPADRPALTIAGRDLVPHPGATANRFNGSTKSRNDGIRIEAAEAAILQSFPDGFEFQGGRSKQFLQIGNAVPPLLAYHVLDALIGE